MRVCLRTTVLGAFISALSPIPAQAAAIVPGMTGTACAILFPGASSSCSVFNIDDPFAAPNVSGEFELDNDVALFRFSLSGQTTFSAFTSSYAIGGFDPTIGLFDVNGTIVQYADPEGSAAFYPARGVDIDQFSGNYDDMLPMLLLGPGTYYLALMEYPNFFKSDLNGLDSLLEGFASDDFAGACSQDGLRTCSFSLAVTAHAVDTTPVPEPGTLPLLVLGSAAAGFFRRRRAREVADRP